MAYERLLYVRFVDDIFGLFNWSTTHWTVRYQVGANETYSEAKRQFRDRNRDVMNVQSPHKWWLTLKSAVFGASSSLPPLVCEGGGLVCESVFIIIIIIIISKGRQCKAGRERLTPYQSEDLNPTTPTHRMREEKGKTVGDKKWAIS